MRNEKFQASGFKLESFYHRPPLIGGFAVLAWLRNRDREREGENEC